MIMSTLYKNCIIATQNEEREVIKGNILVEDGKIIDIGEVSEGEDIINMKNAIVIPALINTHTHLGETMFRGFADGLNTEQYIEFTEIANKRIYEKNSYRNISALSIIESIKNGIGTFFTARNWENAKKFRVKGVFGYPLMKSEKLKNFYESFDKEFYRLCRYHSSRNIKVGIWLHSLTTIEKDILNKVSREAVKNELFSTIHISESRKELSRLMKEWNNKSVVDILDEYNLLNERMVLVHCLYLDERELDIIADKKANVSLCPVSNLKLSGHYPNFKNFLERGINITLGTDGLATNDSANLLETAKITGLLSKKKISSQQLLDMITINAAKALGVVNRQGSIEIGKDADFAIYDSSISNFHPLNNIISNLIYSYTGRVKHLVIEGEFLVRNYKISNIDESFFLNKFKKDCDKYENEIEKAYNEVAGE